MVTVKAITDNTRPRGATMALAAPLTERGPDGRLERRVGGRVRGHGLRAVEDERGLCALDAAIAGAMHWLAAGSALSAAALIAEIDGWEAWPLGSFAATAIYIFGASVQLALVTARRNRHTKR